MTNRKTQTKKLVLGAVMTALVIIMQFIGSSIKVGTFSISLVLVPIVIGSALCDYKIGAWLGLVFGIVVLLSGDAAAFYSVNVFGTIITVLAKGFLCGLAAGLVYKLLETKNRYLAVMSAAVVCPLVNTGVFLLGCRIFFMQTVTEWCVGLGFTNVAEYMFIGLAGVNFILELAINVILAPLILRIISFSKNI